MQPPAVYRARPEGATNVAIAAASSTASTAMSSGVLAVRLMASINAWVQIAATPVATVGTGSWFIPARAIEYFTVAKGDKVAVISDDGVSTGTLNVVELTR